VPRQREFRIRSKRLMREPIRIALLFTAAILMTFAAVVNAVIAVPHLREDMLEIHVRPTLLAAVSLGLSFGTFAMFGFALLVLAAALQTMRGGAFARIPLSIVAATYAAFGIVAFGALHSPHALGYLLMGGLLAAAVAIPGTP
jgi:hypothetical protein